MIRFKTAVPYGALATMTFNRVDFDCHKSAVAIAVSGYFNDFADRLYSSERSAQSDADKLARAIADVLNRDGEVCIRNNRWYPSVEVKI